jgi:hypothetical protein
MKPNFPADKPGSLLRDALREIYAEEKPGMMFECWAFKRCKTEALRQLVVRALNTSGIDLIKTC